jgi:hypothetical protein
MSMIADLPVFDAPVSTYARGLLTIRIELGQDSVAFRRAGVALASLWGRLGRDAAVALKR